MSPLGSASTRVPSDARRVGTITTICSPRTTTPPADSSLAGFLRPRLRDLEDILLQRVGIVHDQASAPLRDHAGALEHRQEAAGGLARGAGQLREVGLRRGHQHVCALAVAHLLVHELAEDDRDTTLHGLEGLARGAFVRLAPAPAEGA